MGERFQRQFFQPIAWLQRGGDGGVKVQARGGIQIEHQAIGDVGMIGKRAPRTQLNHPNPRQRGQTRSVVHAQIWPCLT